MLCCAAADVDAAAAAAITDADVMGIPADVTADSPDDVTVDEDDDEDDRCVLCVSVMAPLALDFSSLRESTVTGGHVIGA